MKYSKLFGKSRKDAPKDEVSTNAKLLLRGGFIDKLMAGSYTLLPLGFRVVKKIENIIREEMNKTGAEELLMPLLHPKSVWNETGRWIAASEVMYQLEKDDKEYALSFTHEEIALDLVRKHSQTYRDYPIKFYHFSTKFRDEPRAKSGILRTREFIMKDLYSLHTNQKDFERYYWEVAKAYLKVFERLGFTNVKITEAGGGVFTKNITHEFQVLNPGGEDTIYYCDSCDFSQNQEISKVKDGDKCPKCKKGKIRESKGIEVGNIFGFGQEYSKKMNIMFANEKGKKEYPYLGSYGIGLTRAIGAIVEVSHDDRGIIWPSSVAPFDVHLILVVNEKPAITEAQKIYETLKKSGVEVLYDDREDVSAGEKFKDADLIGIPVRLVVSAKTRSASSGQAVKVEWKERLKEKTELLSLDEAVKRFQAS